MSSDQWTLTPEGVEPQFEPPPESSTFSLAEAEAEQEQSRAAAAAAAQQQQEEIMGSYQQQLASEEQLRLYREQLQGQPESALPKVKRTKKPYTLVEEPQPSKIDMILEINNAISEGKFNLDRFKKSNKI